MAQEQLLSEGKLDFDDDTLRGEENCITSK